ncbi:peptide chain release factor N(5)-glutamine methyltransferase [Caviibacter abscessus]|uniref:peptide chain release factor N(5)-glutamine methyltransferase n=1 Tax=Caviibacter abscessus TaxID=1766719 RepID=UPI000829FFCA|nr:peptide chain release factor N(5)-glutamine methyltransferase [Caviibacter abscessus]
MSTLLELLKKATNYYEKKGYDNPRVSAEKLFAKALNMDRIMLYAYFDKNITESQKEQIRKTMELSDDFEDEKDTLKSLLDSSIEYLLKHNINEARIIAELIFSKVLNISHMTLFMKYNHKISNDEKLKIKEYILKIAKEKVPYQYLFNEQNFYGRNFYIDKGVLIPRYDTEILVEKVIELVKPNNTILDIGTGSGIIALTIALEVPSTKVLAVDISDKAIEISNINKEKLNASNVKIIKSDIFSNVSYNTFDIIVSNPPYISNDEIKYVSTDTLLHEPMEALFAENDGLYFYYEISRQARYYLKSGGYLAFEIGFKQSKAVTEILTKLDYKDIKQYKDMNGKDRVIIARKG